MKFRFGVAVEAGEAAGFVAALRHLPAAFAAFELPAEWLDSGESVRRLAAAFADRPAALLFRDITSPLPVRTLADGLSPALWLEFDRKFRARCQAAEQLGSRLVSTDFELPRAATEPEYEKKIHSLAAAMSGVLADCGLEMQLSLRLPGGLTPAAAVALLRRLPGPFFRLAVELHPHEPGMAELTPAELLPLRFESSWWRLAYEPGCGNTLGVEVMRLVAAFARAGAESFQPTCIFAPRMDGADAAWAADLAELVHSFQEEMEKC